MLGPTNYSMSLNYASRIHLHPSTHESGPVRTSVFSRSWGSPEQTVVHVWNVSHCALVMRIELLAAKVR